ncbi:MAG: hypothetical protein AAGD34_18005 [Pseudomonadota bacterium]
MIVFIQVPFSGGINAYGAFCELVGRSKVGWVGRNLSLADVRAGLDSDRYSVVGGPIPLADAVALGPISLLTTVLSDPVSRAVAVWDHMEADAAHPFHAEAHTFSIREAFEDNLACAGPISNAAVRFLTVPGAPETVEGLVDALMDYPLLVGFAEHRAAYARALERAMEVPRKSIDQSAFKAAARGHPRGAMHTILTQANQREIALITELRQRHPNEKVLTTLKLAPRKAAQVE